MTSLAELGQPSTFEEYQWQKLRKQMAAHDFSNTKIADTRSVSMGPGFGALELFPATNCGCAGCSIYPRMIAILMVIIILLLRRPHL
jgi:hypothetical protein